MIDEFLAQKEIAIVGVSRNPHKFTTHVYNELQKKGYHVHAVNPHADSIAGIPCSRSLRELPQPVDAAFIAVPKRETEDVVKDAVAAGIRRIWIQQWSESPEAMAFCSSHDVNVISRECILMFAEPVGAGHRFHRWINKLFGLLPQ